MEALGGRWLDRVPGDDRVYALKSVGTLKVQSWRWLSATGHADGRSWEMVRRGFWKLRWVFEAKDGAGMVVGTYEPSGRWRDGGVVCWAGRRLTLRPTSPLSYMYVLADGEHELASFEHRFWNGPVVSVKEPGSLESGLLLFVVFVVRGLLVDCTG